MCNHENGNVWCICILALVKLDRIGFHNTVTKIDKGVNNITVS